MKKFPHPTTWFSKVRSNGNYGVFAPIEGDVIPMWLASFTTADHAEAFITHMRDLALKEESGK